jgi:putative intracellular protease/amidase
MIDDGFDRRTLLALMSAMAATPAAAQIGDTAQAMMPGMHMPLPPGPQPKIAILVHPRMVLLDLVGPMTIMTLLRAEIYTCWKTKTPCITDVGISVTPSNDFASVPADLDVLFVPGGIMGTIEAMNDREVIAFLADRGARAKWVTSICTGGLTLAAAGLLKGYRANSFWPVADLLPLMGATRVNERVVRDRNRITAAGPTSGLDFGLVLAALLRSEDDAKRIQLTLEYSPAPPFHAGTPGEAGPELTSLARKRRMSMDAQALAAAQIAGKRLGVSPPQG